MSPAPAPRHRSSDQELCRCGHARSGHEHLRSGTDCALGDPDHCARFRAADRGLGRRFAAMRGRPRAAGTDAHASPVHRLPAAAERPRRSA